MTNYIFLTKANNEGETIYYAIPSDKIETLYESDTYGDYGQRVSAADAGDSLSLTTEKAVEVANRLANTYEENEEVPADYEVGNIISAYEDGSLYNDMIDAYNAGELTDTDIDISRSEVSGFNYWDGHNWKTITTSCNYSEPSHLVVDDEDLIRELNDAIENASYRAKGFGCEVSTHNEWVVIDSNWQGEWASYEIMTTEDYEYRQQNSSALPAIN